MSKDLSYYQSLHYRMVWEYDKEDQVYFVKFPELPGCLAHGSTEQEALDAALRVKDEWLEATYAAGWEIPEPSVAPETSGRITTRLPKYLHQRLVDRAEAEGVSLNQLILAFVAQGLERTAAEESFKKVLAKQEEILTAVSQTTQTNQGAGLVARFWNSVSLQDLGVWPAWPVGVQFKTLVSTISDFDVITTASGTSSVVSYDIGPPVIGEEKERLRIVKPRTANASGEG